MALKSMVKQLTVKDLYKLIACTSFVSKYLMIKNDAVNFDTVNMSWFSFKKEKKWYEGVYTDINIHSDKKSIFLDEECLDAKKNKKNIELLNTRIDEGFWVLRRSCMGGFEFNWYETFEEARKAFAAIKIRSIKHPNSFDYDKYYFIYKQGQFAMLGYKKESRISKFIYLRYCKYLKNPILIPLNNFYHSIRYRIIDYIERKRK